VRRNILSSFFIFLAALFIGVADVAAQQTDRSQTYATAIAKARAECDVFWSDRALDPLRNKFPFGEEKPTIEMLTNPERIRPQDKPLADIAIKAVERCRTAYGPAFAMLPPNVNSMVQGVYRKQDSLVAELYTGRLTIGEYNIGMNRANAEFLIAISGISQNSSSSNTAVPSQRNEIRIALVVGNATYSSLPRLTNPENDARAIEAVLRELGFRTKLVLNANEQELRREVRSFASESDKADVALVFYAGHGAQVNGDNYLLPVDTEIARTEADIQFTGLKVDDLVNSIRSNTKIIFLDACRDNPALFKNLVKGRSAATTGLAPANASNFDLSRQGVGYFIAYATDAGTIALEGNGNHSPFTEALLRHLRAPISIDDLFSLVTREVRLVTNNTQRPTKYASLQSIICLTRTCPRNPSSGQLDPIQQASQSEQDDYEAALRTNNPDALDAFLQKYPDGVRRNDAIAALSKLRRSEFGEWTLFGVESGNTPPLHFFRLSSLTQFGDRISIQVKYIPDTSAPKMVVQGKEFPNAVYAEQLVVYDCKQSTMALSETTLIGKSTETLFRYKWADVQFLDLVNVPMANPGSIARLALNILCDEKLRTPLVTKKQVAGMRFHPLSSTAAGDGEMYYSQTANSGSNEQQKDVLLVLKHQKDRNVKDDFPGVSAPDFPNYRVAVNRVLVKCGEKKWTILKSEMYDTSNNLAYITINDPSAIQWTEFVEASPVGLLQRIVCQIEFGGIGVQAVIENSVLKIVSVVSGSPAARAGIVANDVITEINGEPAQGLSLNQAIEKMRGPVNSDVKLKIIRGGQGNAVELVLVRDLIRFSPAANQVPK